jgi:Ran GTPase-activating protein (RanGAP) involved in mRNA processing and transport
MNFSSLGRFDQFISENNYLTELNMNNCKLGEDGGTRSCSINNVLGKLLASGLEKNRALQVLLLSNNEFSDNVGSLILSAIKNHEALKQLDISKNKLAVSMNYQHRKT